jgi:hypothetical protein
MNSAAFSRPTTLWFMGFCDSKIRLQDVISRLAGKASILVSGGQNCSDLSWQAAEHSPLKCV